MVQLVNLEESIQKIKENDSAAFEELLQQYVPMIRNLEARYYLLDFDSDDWLQEGRLALHKAVLTYKGDFGTTFGLYFKLLFENAIRSLLRRQQAIKRRVQTDACYFADLELENQWNQFSYGPQVVEDMIIQETIANETLGFSELEEAVFACYLRSFDIEDISRLTGREVITVKGAIDRVKHKIKKRLQS